MPSGVVLVVEDDPTLQLVMKMAISHLGYQCEVVGSGEEALERDFAKVGLIFMDVGLPGIQGLQATARIRENEQKRQARRVPIVALTGHAVKEQCLEAGMDDYLQKPALVNDIQRMLERHLSDGESKRA